MKKLKLTFLAALLLSVFSAATFAQAPTTAKTFRMLNDATHTVSIRLDSTAGAGVGLYNFPQPTLGIMHITAPVAANGGQMSNITIGAIDLTTGDVTGTLTVNKGGTGNTIVGPANSVAFSDGTKIVYTAAPTAAVNSILVSVGGAAPTYSTTLPPTIGVPFANITNGTNTTAAMLVGSGATLFPTGTGHIGADIFTGTGSTSNAVDLNTPEVNGILPVGNGGTGVATAGPAGSIFYSSGPLGSNALASTGAGTNGQILGNVGGVPTWTNAAPNAPRAIGRTAIGASATLTIPATVSISAGTIITVSTESANSTASVYGSYTYIVANKNTVTNTFDVILSIAATGDFVNWAVY